MLIFYLAPPDESLTRARKNSTIPLTQIDDLLVTFIRYQILWLSLRAEEWRIGSNKIGTWCCFMCGRINYTNGLFAGFVIILLERDDCQFIYAVLHLDCWASQLCAAHQKQFGMLWHSAVCPVASLRHENSLKHVSQRFFIHLREQDVAHVHIDHHFVNNKTLPFAHVDHSLFFSHRIFFYCSLSLSFFHFFLVLFRIVFWYRFTRSCADEGDEWKKNHNSITNKNDAHENRTALFSTAAAAASTQLMKPSQHVEPTLPIFFPLCLFRIQCTPWAERNWMNSVKKYTSCPTREKKISYVRVSIWEKWMGQCLLSNRILFFFLIHFD